MSEPEQQNKVEIYEIKLQGHLDPKWSEWFYEMAITHDHEITILCGPLPDQTVLHSVLDRIRDLNLPLLSVQQITSDGTTIDEETTGGSDEE